MGVDTIGGWLQSQADRFDRRIAVTCGGEHRSYSELNEHSRRGAAALAALGVSDGGLVGVLAANSLAAVEWWFAVARMGAIDVPINTSNRGESLRYIIDQTRPRVVICDADLGVRLSEVLDPSSSVQAVIVIGGRADTQFPADVAVYASEELLADPASWTDPALSFRHPSVILYTSGTTGPPKGVVLSHEANLDLARHTAWMMDYSPDDVLLTVFPLFHVNARYTSVMAGMQVGARVVLEAKFSASRFWDVCRREGVTAFNYQGALISILWKAPPSSRDRDHYVRKAMGAPCPVDVWLPFERRFGVKLTEVYGSTEMPIVTENLPRHRRIGSCGIATERFEISIADDDGRLLGPNEVGEILVRPRKPSISISEYFQNERATLEAFRDLWFHSGDRGYMDDDAYLYFVDRVKDSIRRRGENVSSWEVEQAIERHPAVYECAAYGIPSPLSEEDVAVAVVWRDEESVSLRELCDSAADHLPYFAVPRYVRVVEALPRTATQRVEKYRLRDEGVTADTWDREAKSSADSV